MAVVPVARGGREAVTHYQVLATFGARPEPIASLLECTLETGRTHQVRVHLASYRHARDRRSALRPGLQVEAAQASRAAAATSWRCFNRQALHAARLAFVHPATGTLLEFNSPLPADLAEIVDAFKEL